jgi:hypothetical protein
VPHVEPRHVRLYGPAFQLHDVRDVEAHVRTLLDARLREWGARLDAPKYDDALAYLVALCWRLSGLQGDGRTPRVEWAVQIIVAGLPQKLGPFPSCEHAEAAYTAWRATLPDVDHVVYTIVEQRPAGAYNPTLGLAFSTYSRRILARRVVDWYRMVFGDNRYGGTHKPLSLDGLVEDWERDGTGGDDSYLDHKSPGARVDFIDELHRYAYTDPIGELLTDRAKEIVNEEVLARAADAC